MRRMSFTKEMKINRCPARWMARQILVGVGASGVERAASAATIPPMDEAKPSTPSQSDARIDEEMEESRLLMMRRVKQMSVEERLDVFERLSRDAAWILSSAKRIR
jgi:hypothetical protein